MKKCPFCAEEIQDEAIKCRHCSSFLSAAPPAAAAAPAAPRPVAAMAPAPAPAPAPMAAPPFAQASQHHDTPRDRKTIYDGAPSWRAYFGYYFFGALATLLVPAIFYKLLGWLGTASGSRILVFLILLACCGLYFVGLYFYRKSIRFRVTSTNIETERGILSKKIDILELWRCRDVRYKQNLLDRILGIAHIEIFTADVTSPHIEITGLPASRQLFEQIRDSIELQRQARNVYGVVS